MPQRPIDGERVRRDCRLESLRQHDLVDVARGDVFLGRAHHLLELLATDVRADLQGASVRPRRPRERPLELAFDELDLRAGELIQRLEVVVAGDSGVGNDEDPMPHVIEGEHRVEDHEPRFFVGGIGRLQLHRLEPCGGVIREVPDRAAGEARKAGNERRVKPGHQLTDGRDERLVAFRDIPHAIDRRLAAPRSQDEERILAEERIPADLLAALD